MDFNNKNILVLGAGVSGVAVAGILRDLGASTTLSDAKPKESIKADLRGLENKGVVMALGRQDEALLPGIDLIVLSPGISINSPLVVKAQSLEIEVMSEVEVAYRLCPAPMAAITGTNGKTTTTTLIGEIMRATGREVVVGGNIGLALSQEVREISPSGIVVAEISSFQLEGVNKFRPHIGAILNLTPDHIDRHGSLATYQEMKERIFARQTAEDYVVLNYDDPAVREMASRASAKVVFFSRKQQLETGVFVKGDHLVICWNNECVDICKLTDIKIKGAHNVENALAACGVSYFAGASPADMAGVLKTFPGVEHRIEPVATVDGVGYYNDSKATNPESSIKALEAFSGQIILIAGGRDKNTDLSEFMRLIKERVDHLILLGEAKERFRQEAVRQGIDNIHLVEDFSGAVALAHKLARPPQVVLLSPACASYDMFSNYEERGKVFKDLVGRLG